VKSASVVDGGEFDLASSVEDALAATEVDVGRGEFVEALVVAVVVVVVDEGRDGPFEVTREIVILKQDAALQGQMPALDLALCHGMMGLAARVTHALAVQPVGQLGWDVGWSVVAEQARSPTEGRLVRTAGPQGAVPRPTSGSRP
jgi:hypothetical protein